VAEENAEFLEILFGEVRERRQIDAVLGETRGVLAQAETIEPTHDPLHRDPHPSNDGRTHR